MSPKFSGSQYRQVKERRWNVHPIWRGIGLVMLILLPVISFAAAVLIVRANMEQNWFSIPEELSGSFDTPQLASFAPELERVYYMDFALAFLFAVLGFGVFTVIYSFLWGYVGPSRYGPVDSPPIKKSRR